MGLRKARVDDVPAIHKLINSCAERGQVLPRARSKLYDFLRDHVVYEHDARVVAVGALHIVWEGLAEIRSVAVEEPFRKKSIGTEIVQFLIDEAILLGLKRVFVLTFVPDFFKKFGMTPGEKSEMPHKIWADCVDCVYFPDCNEVLLVKELS